MQARAQRVLPGFLGLALAGLLLSEAGAEVPLCRTSVEVEPDRGVVGQQILYRLRILRRRDVKEIDWEQNLGFPGFRAEWLPGILRDESVDRAGESYRVYEERRALFPVRPGALEIPGAGLHCATADWQERVPIPAATVEVSALPATSQPADFSGLVGPVEAALTVTPREVALGEAARISVLVQGPANLWEVRSPLAGAFSLPDAELFSRPRQMARDVGRRLTLRRYFSYDLVPRREGTIRIPEIRIPYFDPDSGRFEQVVLRASELRVTPAAPAVAAETQAKKGTGARLAVEEEAEDDGGVGWPSLAVALAAALAAVAFGWLRRWRSGPRSRWREIESCLGQAEIAREAGDHAEASRMLAKALRAALAAAGAQELSAEEILLRAEDDPTRRLAERLARLDRERFQPDVPPPEISSLRNALEELHRSRRRASC
jgi:hypothetical protein